MNTYRPVVPPKPPNCEFPWREPKPPRLPWRLPNPSRNPNPWVPPNEDWVPRGEPRPWPNLPWNPVCKPAFTPNLPDPNPSLFWSSPPKDPELIPNLEPKPGCCLLNPNPDCPFKSRPVCWFVNPNPCCWPFRPNPGCCPNLLPECPPNPLSPPCVPPNPVWKELVPNRFEPNPGMHSKQVIDFHIPEYGLENVQIYIIYFQYALAQLLGLKVMHFFVFECVNFCCLYMRLIFYS